MTTDKTKEKKIDIVKIKKKDIRGKYDLKINVKKSLSLKCPICGVVGHKDWKEAIAHQGSAEPPTPTGNPLTALQTRKQKEFSKTFKMERIVIPITHKKYKSFLLSSLQEAYEAGEKNKMEYGEPLSTFIQWKGTDVCMDWFCEEGHQNHIDADFAYEIECETCHKIYETGTMIELKKKFTQIKNDHR